MTSDRDPAPFMGGEGPDAAALARAAGLLKAVDDGDTATWQAVLNADAEAGTVYQTFTAMASYVYVLTTAVADLSGDSRETVMANVTAALVNLVKPDDEGKDK